MFNYREVIIQRQTEKTSYNNFREEKEIAVNEFIDDSFIDTVLTDNRSMSIKGTPEFDTNLSPDSYTNKFITSIFLKTVLSSLLDMGLCMLILREMVCINISLDTHNILQLKSL